MSRLRPLALIAVPLLAAGGLLFGSAFGQPAPPTPPTPPAPPTMRHDTTVRIHDGKVEVDGVDIKGMIDGQLQQALDKLDDPSIPPEVREKLRKKLENLRKKADRKLTHLDTSNPEKLGEQLDQMGEEINSEMEGFGQEMEKLGEQVEKKAEQHQFHWSTDDGEEHDDQPETVSPDEDPARDPADLDGISLTTDQEHRLASIREASDRQVESARHELERMSSALHDELADPRASREDIAHQIDAISSKEAEIRKARILAWVDARRVLDDAQRKKVEAAAKKHH